MNKKLPKQIQIFEEPLHQSGYDLTTIIAESVILDAGCGFGELIAQLQEHNPEVYGVDIDAGMINGTKKISGAKQKVKYPDKVQVADVIKLPFEDDYFDTVISLGLFQSLGSDLDYALRAMQSGLNNPSELYRTAMNEIYRVVKRGGLYLVFPNAHNGLPIGEFQRPYPNDKGYSSPLILRK
ncbi:MAG: class I SAM-dependent methyltransferase [Nanoarchaeota archaeon]